MSGRWGHAGTHRDREAGAHRDVNPPWWVALKCRLFGHDWERLSVLHVHCLRCDRNARTPVEL